MAFSPSFSRKNVFFQSQVPLLERGRVRQKEEQKENENENGMRSGNRSGNRRRNRMGMSMGMRTGMRTGRGDETETHFSLVFKPIKVIM
ncbi:MAG: hypothetical protein IPN54_07740 [Bacteroidetes bacterium]|nr:hypothetical protein [Bacteroidota bacterium]